MKFKYYIIEINNQVIAGSNNDNYAKLYATYDNYLVIDAQNALWLDLDEKIIEIEDNDENTTLDIKC